MDTSWWRDLKHMLEMFFQQPGYFRAGQIVCFDFHKRIFFSGTRRQIGSEPPLSSHDIFAAKNITKKLFMNRIT